jgi:hypothetical protein
MWTKESRIQHVPRKERYPSDMTDAGWAIIAPLGCTVVSTVTRARSRVRSAPLAWAKHRAVRHATAD